MTAAFADKNAGTGKTVSLSGSFATDATALGYGLTQPAGSYTANITPLALTITANDQAQDYGAGNSLTQGYDISGGSLVTGESITGGISLSTDATTSGSGTGTTG